MSKYYIVVILAHCCWKKHQLWSFLVCCHQ